MSNRIIIFDTTLRDGEQSPGASLTTQGKLEIALQLARLNVDVIEAGFPVSSPGDFEAVRIVASKVKGPIICGLARALKRDIERAHQALKKSSRPRIHVFLATSRIHMKYKLKKAEEEIRRLAVESVKYARKLTGDIEFSPEDASRSDREFLYRVIEDVIKAGASTVNIPDTVGYSVPSEFGELIKSIKNNVPNVNKAQISVHCHNDLGLAVANSLSAVRNGAGQVECTINGLGERAGNASLEEIVMALATRQDFFNCRTALKTKEIYKTSHLVSKLTGIIVQPNKAVVGQNAFCHEAGIHQDGVLKKKTTYEIIRPEDIGLKESKLVLGKHSGRHAFQARLKKLGINLKNSQLNQAFKRFKNLADKKKEVFDQDLLAIAEDEIRVIPEKWRLDNLHITSGNKVVPAAIIGLKSRGKIIQKSSSGDGPVDACYKTIEKITGIKGKLLDYSLRSITGGKDALGEVTISLRSKSKVVNGRGVSTDILEASVKAYLNAVNKLAYKR
ncbi:MAG: 2-isopropylmalate synthase [Candidatus Omnitrophota bacterium]|nr:2-isopropylmalate synthase [Candidatus Omnitrophota bacterium]